MRCKLDGQFYALDGDHECNVMSRERVLSPIRRDI
jgi:hypothetical protein